MPLQFIRGLDGSQGIAEELSLGHSTKRWCGSSWTAKGQAFLTNDNTFNRTSHLLQIAPCFSRLYRVLPVQIVWGFQLPPVKSMDVIDLEDELADEVEVPDIHTMFAHYDRVYFNSELGACSVEWSPKRMTRYYPSHSHTKLFLCELPSLIEAVPGQTCSQSVLLYSL